MEFILRSLIKIAGIFGFLMPVAIRLSKEYLQNKYKAAFLEKDPSIRENQLRHLASLRQTFHPPAEQWLVNIRVEEIPMKANLCQQYCGDIYYGVGFEQGELSIVNRFVQNGDVFLDVGANIGIYTLLASRLVGENGRVHSFEPQSDVYDLLRSNINLNQCLNVITNPVAVGEQNGETQIFINAQNALSSLGRTNRGVVLRSQKVPLVTLDEYAGSMEISKADFLKIDVEGFEGHVLRGAAGLLNASPNLVVMSELAKKNFAPLGFSIEETLNWMRAQGFEVWMIGGQDLKLYPTRTSMGDYPYQNFLFIRPGNPRYPLVREYSAAS